MKIETSHLESVRALLVAATERLAAQSKAAKEAEESRLQIDGQVRSLQSAFDVLAAAYAGDVEPSAAQLDGLPQAVKDALGYVPAPSVVSKTA